MSARPSLLRLFALLVLALSLSACQNIFKKEEPTETLPLEGMYAEGKEALVSGNLARAEKYYRRLVARFPYGKTTEQSLMELAYAQYKNNKPEEASATINRFLKTYPTHRHADYMYYLRGLLNFDRSNKLVAKVVGVDMTMRDQAQPLQSFNHFAELLQRYPNSKYAADARQRMVFLRDQLARHEMNVAKYYLRRRAYVASAQRAKYLVENYPQTKYVPDAVAMMAVAYQRLGQQSLQQDAERVLRANEPNHPYFAGKWPESQVWWKKLNPFTSEVTD